MTLQPKKPQSKHHQNSTIAQQQENLRIVADPVRVKTLLHATRKAIKVLRLNASHPRLRSDSNRLDKGKSNVQKRANRQRSNILPNPGDGIPDATAQAHRHFKGIGRKATTDTNPLADNGSNRTTAKRSANRSTKQFKTIDRITSRRKQRKQPRFDIGTVQAPQAFNISTGKTATKERSHRETDATIFTVKRERRKTRVDQLENPITFISR